jgi:hypothetical protein
MGVATSSVAKGIESQLHVINIFFILSSLGDFVNN